MNVLIVNAGSSSLKYQLFDTVTKDVLAKGNCERIGIGGKIQHKSAGKEEYIKEIQMDTHADATKILVETLTNPEYGCISSMNEIHAVGHRVVHGGPYFQSSVLMSDDAMEKVKKCGNLAPLHTGPVLMGIDACVSVMPNVPQVFVFDTAFHQTMPAEAYTYALPNAYFEKYALRRYGFHGSSHKYVSREMIKLLDMPKEDTKIITCHLGNGSSISAIKGGKVIDTTMGMTPLEGLPMGTRSGTIDPAIVTFLMEKENLSIKEMNDILNKKSGLLGISGHSSDFRDLLADMDENPEGNSALAVRTLAYQIKKTIGAYTAALGGVDAVVFTAGIGENNDTVRQMSMAGLEYLGIDFDSEVNKSVKRPVKTTMLSTENSKVKVYLIPTNEELIIAEETEEIVNAQK